MTQFQQGQNQKRTKTDVGRARLRKIKRDHGINSSHSEAESSHRRAARQRDSSRTGPSIRERLAETHINIPSPSIHSIQEKISSTIEHSNLKHTTAKSSKKVSSYNTMLSPRNSRRRTESQRSGSLFEATPRAETQRKTSGDRILHPIKTHRVFDARSEAVPPVMVRGGMDGMTFGRAGSSRTQKKRSPRRRIDVPLNIPGAEVRLPSLPIFRLGWRVVSLLMVLMMAACLVLVWKAPVFQVNTVEAEGLQRLTVGDLNAVMGTFGKSVFTINPTGLEETLQQAFPELSQVLVKVSMPANVKVVVIEREPVIAWSQDGTEFWLDADGVSFPPRGNPANPLVRVEGRGDLPTVSSSTLSNELQNMPPGIPSTIPTTFPRIKLSSELVSAILVLGAKLPSETMLVYDSEHGLGWNDPNGWEVFFGEEDQDMEMKLGVYQALVERLQSEGIQPALISVEYVHAPYYRMER